jgi:hypothetical protein
MDRTSGLVVGGYPIVDESLDRLHRASWSIGDAVPETTPALKKHCKRKGP